MKGDRSGSQCCAMVVAALLKNNDDKFKDWKSTTMDEILNAGDSLYYQVMEKLTKKPSNGFLLMQDFQVLNEVKIIQKKFKIICKEDPEFFGTIGGSIDFGWSIEEALKEIFEKNSNAVLITNG